MSKRLGIIGLLLALLNTGTINPSIAGLDATIDLSNPRIVPMYVSDQLAPPNSADQASYSGFLYSSRIVFSAAHSEYYFDGSGKIINRQPKEIYVGKPNSKAGDVTGAVRVIKRIISTSFRYNNASLGDFVIYVLEKDLIDIGEVNLLTPEIEKELISSQTPIKMHGYGEYLDRCLPGEKLPCTLKGKKSEYPRTLTSRLITLDTAERIVGYSRPQLSTSLIINNGKTGFGCGGDSGGSITTTYKGEMLYIATTPNGMNGYACGASGDDDGKGGINYTSAVYNHLNILSEAKSFVAEMKVQEQIALEAKALQEAAAELKAKQEAEAKAQLEAATKAIKKTITITCLKGKKVKKVTAVKPKCPSGYKKRLPN